MKCYHHNDPDGRASGFIIRNKFPECEMIEVDYSSVINIDAIDPDEVIYIVDFSFKPNVMKKVLKKTDAIVWIDHHKTAFEYDYGVKLSGLRNTDYSGCELTWMWFNPDSIETMPEYISLIGDYDKWAHKKLNGKKFHLGLEMYAHGPNDVIWDQLDSKDGGYLIDQIIEKGAIAESFRDAFCTDYMKKSAFYFKFRDLNCLINGIYHFGSLGFVDRINDYDMCINYVYNGEKWIIGLYSVKIDVSVIAKEFGGGGHIGAAGFTSDLPPWEILV